MHRGKNSLQPFFHFLRQAQDKRDNSGQADIPDRAEREARTVEVQAQDKRDN